MITYVDFSLFESPSKVLVNTVNTVGVMGKGIAKEFKRVYPEMFEEYQRLCERDQFHTGDLWLYKTPHKWVLNFPTKRHWRNPSKTEYIKEGLDKFARIYRDAGITQVSFPMLGCGNGELDWEKDVKPLVSQFLDRLPIEILIHVTPQPSQFVAEQRTPATTKRWLRSQPETLSFVEVWDDLTAILVQKRHFATLDSQERFVAGLVPDEEEIFIESDAEGIKIHKDQMLDLWQQIRESGLCVPQAMPRGLDRWSQYILPILNELSYLKPIHQAEQESRLNKNAIGLLFEMIPSKRKVEHGPVGRSQLSFQLL